MTWTWRGRLGLLAAALWFLLQGLPLVGIGTPQLLHEILALLAGVLLLIGV